MGGAEVMNINHVLKPVAEVGAVILSLSLFSVWLLTALLENL